GYQDCNNADDHEQLDERKPVAAVAFGTTHDGPPTGDTGLTNLIDRARIKKKARRRRTGALPNRLRHSITIAGAGVKWRSGSLVDWEVNRRRDRQRQRT